MVNSESLAKGLVEGSRRLDWLRHQPTLPKGYGPQCVLDKRTCRGSKGLRLVEGWGINQSCQEVLPTVCPWQKDL